MDYDVQKVELDDEFKVCPACGYKDGFHSMFRKGGQTTQWLFVCPACHKVFDVGFAVPNG